MTVPQPTPPSPPHPLEERGALALVIIALIASLAHAQALTCGWIWDDDSYVTRNLIVQASDGWLTLWKPGATPQYYPLVFLGFWVEHFIFGLEPFWFHLTNLLMHVGSAALLATVLHRIGVPHAWWIAAIFAAHPMGVESVAWVTERKNVQSMLLALLSVRMFLPILEARTGGLLTAWLLSFTVFVAALLSKTTAVFVPPCLVMIALWQGRRVDGKMCALLTPFFAVGIALGLVTAGLERTHVGATGADFALTWLDRLQLAGLTTSFYIQTFALPLEQVFIYPRFAPDATVLHLWIPAVVFGALLVAMAIRWRAQRAPLLLALWLGAGLFPALGFFDVWPFRFSYVADHFAYAAMPCLATIATLLATRAGGALRLSTAVGRALGAAVLCVLILLSNRAVPKYESEETLWRDTLAKNPEAWIAANNLASLRLAEAEVALQSGSDQDVERLATEALGYASRAGELKPTEFTNAVNRSEAFRLLGKRTESLSEIEAAARLAPTLSDVQWMLGRALAGVNRNEEAKDAFRRAVELARTPDDEALAQREIMRIAVATGKLDIAADACARLVELQPGDADMAANLGALLLAVGRDDAGRRALLQAAKFEATRFANPEVWTRVSIRYLRLAADATLDPREAAEARTIADRLMRTTKADPAARYLQLAVELALGDQSVRGEIGAIGDRARQRGDVELAEDVARLLAKPSGNGAADR